MINNTITPKKLKKGSHIRVIAPSRSMKIISSESQEYALKRLEEFGFKVSFAVNISETDEFNSSSVISRITDLHNAFSDPSVDAIFTVIGGYNSNQLLNHIDFDLIKKNPKIICGFSDITALNNAITAKTGMITYIGPHFSSWAMMKGFEYSIEYFVKSCMEDRVYELPPSDIWSDDPWYLDQVNRNFIKNEGYWIMNPGHAVGRTVGGHVRCLNALQGTDFWPSLDDSILLLEEDSEINPELFDRELQSIIHQSDFKGVQGIIIGRFQRKTSMTKEKLAKIIGSKPALKNVPIIANVDLGHTTPLATFPIGGAVELSLSDTIAIIRIIEH